MSDQITSASLQSPQARLGELLREQRLAKKTETTELARTLILSSAQITAIETGSQASFHNQTFYLRALKKYIAHMALATDPQASLLFTEIETELLAASTKINANEVNLLINAGLAHSRPSYLPQLRLKKTHVFWVGFISLVLVGLAAALIEGWPEKQTKQQTDLVSTPVPAPLAASVPTPTPAKKIDVMPNTTVVQEQKPATAAPTSFIIANAQPSDSKAPEQPPPTANKTTATMDQDVPASLKLTFSAPSWVQAVEQNGKRIEKVFNPQDVLELDQATLATLVIGNARETKLFTKATEIDISKYLNAGSGVARFNQAEIMKLGQ
jgi:cytoskeletal protein RodZ